MRGRKFISSRDLAIQPKAIGLSWPRAPMSCETTEDGIAVLSIDGPLQHKGKWFDSYESILSRFKGALHDDAVFGVILKIDSPGGEVNGLQETVRAMRAMKESHGKPISVYCDDEAYSAAYALATVGDDIYLPEGGGVGSVGVLATVCDRTEATKEAGLRIEVVRSGSRKAEGHPDIPLDDVTLGRVQDRVDDLAQQFFRLVAQVRPVKLKALEALQGQTVFGEDAVSAGLADGIMSFDETLELMRDKLSIDSSSGYVRVEGDYSAKTRKTGESMSIAALQKKVALALAAVTNAKTTTARKSAATALARAQAVLTEAKVKKAYKKRTVEEESEEDDGEDEQADESEDSVESEEDAEGDDDDVDDDDGGDEEESKMKKSKKSSNPSTSIAAFVKSLTGQSSSKEALDVLSAMHAKAREADSATKRIEKLESDARKAKLDALVSEGVSSGKIKPAQIDWAKTQSAASLKAFLDATPALFAPRQATPEAAQEYAEDTGKDGLTDVERKICQISGVSAESYKAQKTAGLPKIAKVN